MTVHMQADQHGRSNVRQREDALWDPELECCHCNRDEETDPCACQKELGAGKAVGATEQTHGTSSDVSASIQDTTEHGEGNGEDENGNEGDEQDNNGIGEDPDGLSVHGWEGR
ncbi:hypothetical protein BU16DRAFT_522220 [Lophium mytilinum]|uniref:Uncharacterized protein n=1 Tax=Lophium mytilinum TaxID=390894 RepID=A0A6A6RA27_9PEZI|nr:hypothetical protein BU16DRAFT_522220 [Lophium mytilinum]